MSFSPQWIGVYMENVYIHNASSMVHACDTSAPVQFKVILTRVLGTIPLLDLNALETGPQTLEQNMDNNIVK